MISVICVYNNRDILNDCLIASLNKQTIGYEAIFIDNTDNTYRSAASALNAAAEKATGDYLIFVHQDVIVKDKAFLEKIETEIRENLKNALIGVAGVRKEERIILGNITDGLIGLDDSLVASENTTKTHFRRISYATAVFSVDELLIGMSKETWGKYPFDEQICSDWHFYAVELCMRLNAKQEERVFVIPADVHHNSNAGSMNSGGYYSTLRKLLDKYAKIYDCVYATTGVFPTKGFRRYKVIFWHKFKILVNRDKVLKLCWLKIRDTEVGYIIKGMIGGR